MWNIELLIKYISAAQASYGNVLSGSFAGLVGTQESGFTEVQKIELGNKFSLVPKSGVDNESGFQAVLLQPSDGGNKILAIRGSEEIWNDFVDADLTDIGPEGFATDQALDLFRYWKRITTPAGVDVSYSLAEINALWGIYELGDSFWGLFGDVVAFADMLRSDIGLGVIGANEVVDITGHSLGGNLAYVFASMFPNNVNRVVTINAPGVDRVWINPLEDGQDNLVDLGFSIVDGSKVTSINAEGDLVHLVSGTQPGTIVDISQEVGTIPLLDGLSINHSVVNSLDSLNLMKLFATLDPTQKADPSGILMRIMQRSSNEGINTFENMLDGLRKLLMGENVQFTPAGSKSDLQKRERLYENIKELSESGHFVNLKEHVTLIDVSTNSNLAKTNWSQFLSLYHGLPYALDGSEAILSQLDFALFSMWKADSNLTIEERKSGKANFSDSWYEDRARYLQLLIERNEDNTDSDNSTDWFGENGAYISIGNSYSDSGKIYSGFIDGDDLNEEPYPPRFVFGTNESNTPANSGPDGFVGGNGNDRIYGLGGDDKINGLKGHDVLDGGAGKDELLGGEGTDLLLGGAGDDKLEGGVGNDVLKGGSDNDTYKFSGDFGRDIIIDNEGTDVIDVDGVLVGELKQTTKDSLVYSSSTGSVEAILIDNGGSKTLLINSITNRGSSITIDNWTPGQFGITLTKANDENTSLQNINNGDGKGNNLFHLNDPATGKDLATEIKGGDGVDFIHGGAGDDRLSGGTGNDWITAGSGTRFGNNTSSSGGGNDVIDGGDNNDVISGMALKSSWYGGKGNDMLLGNYRLEMNFLAMPGDGETDTRKLGDFAWQDFSNLLKFGFTVDQETKDGKTEVGYSAWAGIEPGTYTGTSARGGGYTYLFNIENTTPLVEPDVKFRGVSNFIYDVGHNRIDLSYSNPATNEGAASGIYAHFSLTPKSELAQGLTRQTAADVANLQLFGGEDDDLLLGWWARDELYGDEGKDALFAGDGNDLLDGGTDNDTVGGGWGNDTILGGQGDDLLIGDEIGEQPGDQGADDVIFGGAGNDTLNGNAGNDYLHGGADNDYLAGDEGNDYLFGGDGVDTLDGGKGADTLVGSFEDSYVAGGEDDDIYIIETSIFSGAASKSFSNASANSLLFRAADTTKFSVEATTNAKPLLTIQDDGGHDTLALVGVNSLQDLTLTAKGNDLIVGHGNNRLYVVSGLNGGIDQIAVGSSVDNFMGAGGSSAAASNSLDNLLLTNLFSSISRTAVSAGGLLTGGLLNDTLTAHQGGSTVIGGKGDDILVGDVGDDTYVIRAGDGHDTVTERGGNNRILFAEGIVSQNVVVRRSNGDLLVKVSSGELITVKGMFDQTSGAVIAEKSIQEIEFFGGEKWELSTILQGSLQGDSLVGSDNADRLVGSDGSDTVKGGKGNDALQGGTGNDHYYLSVGDGVDVVTDTLGHDHLYLSGDFNESQITVRKDTNNNLVIRINNQDAVVVTNAIDEAGEFSSGVIEEIHIGNSIVWDLQKLRAELTRNQIYTFAGTSGSDQLVGDNAQGIFVGRQGNDELNGGSGDDLYTYQLGDGNDVIQDLNGVDKVKLVDLLEEDVLAVRDGSDLLLRMSDGGSITVKNAFEIKPGNEVGPTIAGIIEQLQNKWISQAENLIADAYGLVGNSNIDLEFENGEVDDAAAYVQTGYSNGSSTATSLKLVIDLADFSNGPNGAYPLYHDRIIAHEMVHAVMALNMDITLLPAWFNEGVAEFIHGADERVNSDMWQLDSQENFNALFNIAPGSPSTSAGYSVSYIAVKLLDKEIRNAGGNGIRDVFDQLKTGESLNQALFNVSSALGFPSNWFDLATFEAHFQSVGFAQYKLLLNLFDIDTGSIVGSDYGRSSLGPDAIFDDFTSGQSNNLKLVISSTDTSSPEQNGKLEFLEFSNGSFWDWNKISSEAIKNEGRMIFGGDGSETLNGSEEGDFIEGRGGDDFIFAAGGDDYVAGGIGNDWLYGDGGNDTLIGGLGSDILFGGAGYNTYIFDGNDAVGSDNIQIDFLSEGKIIIGDGVSVDDLKFTFSGSYGITYGNSGIYLNGDDLSFSKWTIKFSDAEFNLEELLGNSSVASFNRILRWDGSGFGGTRWNDIISLANASPRDYGFTNIWSYEGNDILEGHIYDDSLYAGADNDTLNGGLGDDTLVGDTGNDTYLYKFGSGNDVIIDSLGIDRVEFGAGILPGEVVVTRSNSSTSSTDGKGTDLVFTFTNGQSLKIKDVFELNSGNVKVNNVVEEFKFANDTYWTFGQALNLIVGDDSIAPQQPSASFDSSGAFIQGVAETGSVVEAKSSTGNILGTATANTTTGSYSISLQTALVNNEVVNVTAIDAAGNASPINVIRAPDYTAPEKTTVFHFSELGTFINGNAEAGSLVEAKDIFGLPLGSVMVGASSGTYSLNFNNVLNSGEVIYLTVKDSAGNLSPNTVITAPNIQPPQPPSATFDLAGEVISGVAVYRGLVEARSISGALIGSVTVHEYDGLYSLILDKALTNGEEVHVTVKSLAGKTSPIRVIMAPDVATLNPADIIIQAENYTSMSGVQKESTSDVGGGQNAGYIDAGDWMAYNNAVFNVPAEGRYRVTYRVASLNGGGRLTLKELSTDAALGSITVPKTSGWQNWVDVTQEITLSGGDHNFKLAADIGGFNINWFKLELLAPVVPDTTPPVQPTAAFDPNGMIISGVAEVGSVVVIKDSSNINTLGTVTADTTTGAYSITLATALINKESVNVTATDSVGNTSATKAIIAPDNTAPGLPNANFDTAGKVISGNAEAGSVVVVKNANNTSTLGTATADATTGAYSIILTTALINKESVNVTATDSVGNISAIKAIIAPDKTAPGFPTANFDAAGKVISGTAEAGSVVVVKNANNTSTLGTVTAHATTGAYSITLVTALINKETVNITATDAAGNISVARAVVAPDIAGPNPSALIIQAENYTSMSGVQKESTSDVGGGQNAGYIDAGDWMAYNNSAFNVPAEGRYRVTYRVASLNGGGRLTLKELSTDAALGSITVPKTSGWQNWVDVTQEITLSGGDHNFKLAADIGGFNINWFKLEPLASAVPDTTPPVQPTAAFDAEGKVITGVAEAGSVIVIKNADSTSTLGTVIAHATTGAYSITLATALINKESVNVTATDSVGNISAIKAIIAPDKTAPAFPTANFDSAGKVISGAAEAGSVVVVKNANNTSTLGTVTAHATTGAYSITLVTALINKETVNITATDAAGNVSVARAVVAPDAAAPNPSALVIQAENYTSMSGVQKESTSDVGGGQNAGYIDAGDWMAYNAAAFNVPAEGRYRVTYRVASLNGGGRLTLKELSTDAALGSITIPKTGTWQTWVDVTQEITLSGGVHNFKLAADIGGFNINWFKLESLEPTSSVTTTLTKSTAMIDLQDNVITGIAEAGNVVVVQDANTTSTLGTVIADATKGVYETTEIVADVSRLKTDYESVHYVSSNDALIQAMASFVSGSCVDTRYRSTQIEQGQVMIAVGS